MSFGIAFAFPAYDNPPNVGPFTQAGPTLDLLFTGVPTVNSTFVGQSLDLNFLSQQYQLPAQYSVWDSSVGALTSKTFSQIITFTRASTATYFDSTGTLQTAATDAPRFDYNPTTLVANGFLIEEARTNSIRNNLMASAVPGSPGTLPINFSIAGNASTVLSRQIVGTGTDSGITYIDIRFFGTIPSTASPEVYVLFETNTNTSVAQGQTWTASSYVKIVSGTQTGILNGELYILGYNSAISLSEASSTVFSYSSLTGTFPACRVSKTYTFTNATTVSATCRLDVNFLAGGGSIVDFTIRIGMPQLELGAFVTSVIPSTPVFTSRASTATYVDSSGLIATAAANVARYQYNPQNLSAPPVLLVEEAATNRLLYTEQFDNAVWTKSAGSVTVSANTTVAPDGATTADTVTANQDAGVYQTVIVSIGSTNCQSIFVKAGTATSMMFRDDSGAGRHIVFNPTTGVINSTSGTLVGYGSQAFGNGWWRYWFSYVADAVNIRGWIRPNSAGSGQTFIVWGAQTEAGPSLTSYIPNVSTAGGAPRSADIFTNAAVTRAADVASVNTLSPWYNAAEGTLFAQAAVPVPAAYTGYAYILGDFNNGTQLYRQSDSQPVARVRTASVDSFINGFGAVWATTAANKNALAYAVNNFASSNNGGAVAVSSSGSVPTVSILRLGAVSSSGSFLNGYLQRITYYPRRVANYELQALTV
jgi:hypothetical protein